jgi:hypothetical protein
VYFAGLKIFHQLNAAAQCSKKEKKCAIIGIKVDPG